MSGVVTVPELLDGHTVLDIECPDRKRGVQDRHRPPLRDSLVWHSSMA
jgi:hypothetical protein